MGSHDYASVAKAKHYFSGRTLEDCEGKCPCPPAWNLGFMAMFIQIVKRSTLVCFLFLCVFFATKSGRPTRWLLSVSHLLSPSLMSVCPSVILYSLFPSYILCRSRYHFFFYGCPSCFNFSFNFPSRLGSGFSSVLNRNAQITDISASGKDHFVP